MKSELMYSPQKDPYRSDPPPFMWRIRAKYAAIRSDSSLSRQLIIAGILAVSLIAFEIFNYDPLYPFKFPQRSQLYWHFMGCDSRRRLAPLTLPAWCACLRRKPEWMSTKPCGT
ncbi:MAG: hypothetical protein M9918_12085 [Anaerolineae bacterium]|nr:hypothetical protein [Anaerolineae bacterium]